MNRLERPRWFAAGAAAMALAALLGMDIRAPQPRPDTTAIEDSPPPETTPEPEVYEASMAAGRQIVERAIEAGRWTHKDVAAFGAATATLELPDRLALHQRLIAAVNEDRVQLQ